MTIIAIIPLSLSPGTGEPIDVVSFLPIPCAIKMTKTFYN